MSDKLRTNAARADSVAGAATFTPGPWGRLAREIVDSRGVRLAVTEWRGMGGTAVAEANARLIAAAPDLLEALKQAVADAAPASNPSARMPNYEQAVAAIAKTEAK